MIELSERACHKIKEMLKEEEIPKSSFSALASKAGAVAGLPTVWALMRIKPIKIQN